MLGPSKTSGVLHEHNSFLSYFVRAFSVLRHEALSNFFAASLLSVFFRDFSVLHEHASVFKIFKKTHASYMGD